MLHALDIVRSGMPSARQHRLPQRRHVRPAADARGRRDARARRRRRDPRPHRLERGFAEFLAHPRGRARRVRRGGVERRRSASRSRTRRAAASTSCSAAWRSREGDEIVTTDNEHAGPARAARRARAPLRRQSCASPRCCSGGDAARRRQRADRPAHALVALSHVLWANGRVLPLRAIADAAHAAGVPVLVRRRPERRRDRRRSGRARGRRVRRPRPEVAVRAERRRASCGSRRASRIASRSPRRATTRATSASEGAPFWPGARRHDGASLTTGALAGAHRRRRVPARARRLERGRGADGRRARALRRAAARRCPA